MTPMLMILFLAVVGGLLFIFKEMDPKIRSLIVFVACVVVAIWLLDFLGLYHFAGSSRL